MKKLIIAALLSLPLSPAFAWDTECKYMSFKIDVLNCTATHQIDLGAHKKELFITHQENSDTFSFWFIDESPYAVDDYEQGGVVRHRLDGDEIVELGPFLPAGRASGGHGFVVEKTAEQAQQLFRSMQNAHIWRLSAPTNGEGPDTYVHVSLSGFNEAISLLQERTQ